MPHRPKPFQKEAISVAFMIEQLRTSVKAEVEAVNDVPADERKVIERHLHRPGLVLAGFLKLFSYKRVQILGNTENEYLADLAAEEQLARFKQLVEYPLPCIILTEANTLPDALVAIATEAGIPVYRTPLPSTDFMGMLGDFLYDQFALQQSIHGSLVDVYGVGLLLVGSAGIGKSEVALDLVERGHRLVADDVVILTKKAEQVLMGAGTDLVEHFMEIRGLGLIDVRAMFGIRAIRFQKRVEVVVRMELWDEDEEYTRIDMVDDIETILGVQLPVVRLPITPGKNITVLCEVIAMNHLLRNYGYDPAKVFAAKLARRIREKSTSRPARGTEYFEHDFE